MLSVALHVLTSMRRVDIKLSTDNLISTLSQCTTCIHIKEKWLILSYQYGQMYLYQTKSWC